MVLTFLSTVQDVTRCTDTELTDGIGKLDPQVVMDYVLHIRMQLAAKEITINRLLEQPSGAPGQDVANKLARLEVAHDNLRTDHDLTKQSLARVLQGQAQSTSSSAAVMDGLAGLNEEIEQLKSSTSPPNSSPPNSSPVLATQAISAVDAGFFGLAKIFLRGSFNNWFVGTDGQFGVHCNVSNCLITEEIRIIRNRKSNFSVSLKSYHGYYLSAQRDGKLRWDRTYNDRFEKFDVIVTGDPNVIRLKSYHGKWVSARQDGKIVADCGDEYASDACVHFTVCPR